MSLHVHSYTIYHSPNAYLGTILLRRKLAKLPGVTLTRKPIFVPRALGILVSEMLGGKENRNAGSYNREDCGRWAQRMDIPFRYPEPGIFQARAERWAQSPYEREELPARAFYAADNLHQEALDRALFEAAWVEGLDVNEEKVVRQTAAKVGIDTEILFERIGDPEKAECVRRALEEFLALRCPGVPTAVVDGERFFGKDRVDWIYERCKQLTTLSENSPSNGE